MQVLMNRLILSGILLFAGAARALAADAVIADPLIEVPGVHDWSGYYVGVQLGYGWADFDRENTDGFENSFDGDGFLGGAHAGGNFQSGAFVYGAEADIEFANVEGDDDFTGGALDTVNIEWLGSLRGRLGYAWDRLLIYGTGGVALAGVDADYFDDGDDERGGDRNTHVGWTIGAGAEWAFADNWSTRVEYRYTDFSSETYEFEPDLFDADYDIKLHAVRFGLSYHF